MILLLIGATFALLFAVLTWAFMRNPRNPELSRITALVCSFMAALSLSLGLALYPLSEGWQADRYAKAAEASARGDAQLAKSMIEALGSPEAYLEYLKAKKVD